VDLESMLNSLDHDATHLGFYLQRFGDLESRP
jgi:hypothetical protein